MALNADELVFPDWLNDEFFTQVIRQFEGDESIVLTDGVQLRPGTNAGDHYASVMYRTTLHYRSRKSQQNKSLPVIMKTKPMADGHKKELLDNSGIFKREIEIYEHVLPQLSRLLKEIGEELVCPRYIYGSVEVNSTIILEDVSGQGWRLCDSIATFDEAKPAIKSIAKFHAASVMLETEDVSIKTKYYTDPRGILQFLTALANKTLQELIDLTESSDEFTRFKDPLERLKSTLEEKVVAAYTSSENFPNVLIHGDFHAKNLLHQVDDHNCIKNTMLIDYQVCGWTTPVVDLYYLLDMVVAQSLKESHRDELIHYYYVEYSGYLRKLGYLGRIPTMLDLQIEMLKGGAVELLHDLIFYPMFHIDPATVDFAALLMGQLPNPALNDPEFRRVMKMQLTKYLHQGTIF